MNRRRRHHLDLLPLLDIFMTVLFVFATIQEKSLDESAQASAEVQQELAELRARGPAIDPAELKRLREAQAASERAEQAARAQLADAQAGQAQLQTLMNELRAAAEEAAKTGTASGTEQLRRQDVLSKLLDQFSVFEVEIDGTPTETGVINHCCYRSEPIAGAWQSCGQIPAATVDLQDWLASGGAGLVDALRRTRGGNAMTIVRQNERASWRIGRKLEEQLRERLPEHKIYGEGVAVHALACAPP